MAPPLIKILDPPLTSYQNKHLLYWGYDDDDDEEISVSLVEETGALEGTTDLRHSISNPVHSGVKSGDPRRYESNAYLSSLSYSGASKFEKIIDLNLLSLHFYTCHREIQGRPIQLKTGHIIKFIIMHTTAEIKFEGEQYFNKENVNT